jgi:hypothetical protein
MSKTIGIAAKVFIALRDAKVNVRIINQGASELNIIVGVVPEDYERALGPCTRRSCPARPTPRRAGPRARRARDQEGARRARDQEGCPPGA